MEAPFADAGPNYFHYFTDIEVRFSARRGSILLLSTLDWALIETWREAGIPLEAVLRGIDAAFAKRDARAAKSSRRQREVNGLAWCAQAVMEETEAMRAAAVGGAPATRSEMESGFESTRIAAYLRKNAQAIFAARFEGEASTQMNAIAAHMETMADDIAGSATVDAESVEAGLSSLEERMFAALTLHAEEPELLRLREQAARELAPHRAKMSAAQSKQVVQQFVQKRLLEASGLPRLSLFYMDVA